MSKTKINYFVSPDKRIFLPFTTRQLERLIYDVNIALGVTKHKREMELFNELTAYKKILDHKKYQMYVPDKDSSEIS